VIETLSRVAQLFVLVFAPRVASPDPPTGSLELAALGVLVLAVGPIGAGYLVRSYDVLESKVALGLWLLADVMLLVAAITTANRGAPLLYGYYLAAPPVWSALAATLATLAGQYLGVAFKNKRMGAAIITLAIGIFTFRDASVLIASPSDQWRSALLADPDHERALLALGNGVPAATLDACVSRQPTACVCRVMRAERALEAERAAAALEDLSHASCAGHPLELRAEAAKALGLAIAGRGEEASEIASKVLVAKPDDARALFAMALAASQRQDVPAALDFDRQAIDAGSGRGALLLESQLLIRQRDFGGARSVLRAFLEQHPDDPDGVYNLALVDDLEGRYNPAREGYLKALRLRPALADARYNLALLTLRHGFTDEAKNHVRKFIEAFPKDPRGAGLEARLPL